VKIDENPWFPLDNLLVQLHCLRTPDVEQGIINPMDDGWEAIFVDN
jgi:hypothetical protein